MNYRLTVINSDGSRVLGYARSEYSIGNYGTVLLSVDGKDYRAAEVKAKGMKLICLEEQVQGVLQRTGFPLAVCKY